MREIKFRGRSDVNNVWHYGDLATGKSPAIVEGDIYTRFFYVDPATVDQFTGLKDHKGREIYEGDIVKVIDDGEESFHVVKYIVDEDYPAFDIVPGLNVDSNGLAYCEHYAGYDVKMYVIGNIHDNPELLRLTKTGGFDK